MKNSHQIGFDKLSLKILFSEMINMIIFFSFFTTLNKDYMFKIDLFNIFIEIQENFTIYFIAFK